MRIVALATGIGNVRSVVRALERAVTTAEVEARSTSTTTRTHDVVTSADPEMVRRADVLVVPGQGSFGAFAAAIDGALRDAILDRIRNGAPYFGICLGLQILFDESDEAPGARGLGVLRGRVRRLAPGVVRDTGGSGALPLPHVGWNRAEHAFSASADRVLVDPGHYYFAHSYVVVPDDATIIQATTTYGDATFVSAVRRDNIAGVQFHPEKSQTAGLSLLERFFAGIRRNAKET